MEIHEKAKIFFHVIALEGDPSQVISEVISVKSRSLMSYFSETIKDRNVKFWHNLHSSLQFVLSKFKFDIFDTLENMRFYAT